MNRILQIISLIGILLTIVPPILLFNGVIIRTQQNALMLLGVFVWFFSAYFWLGRKSKKTD